MLEALHSVDDREAAAHHAADADADADGEARFDAAAAVAARTHVRCEQCWVWSLRSSCGECCGLALVAAAPESQPQVCHNKLCMARGTAGRVCKRMKLLLLLRLLRLKPLQRLQKLPARKARAKVSSWRVFACCAFYLMILQEQSASNLGAALLAAIVALFSSHFSQR